MGELADVIKEKEVDPKCFMFVVTPDEKDDDEFGSWEGSIKQMNKIFHKRVTSLRSRIDNLIQQLEHHSELSDQRDEAQDKDMKKQVF